ncbi:MAG: pyridoxamine 5'-phosphate oxidase family protein [Salinigranum sp.]
MSVFQYGAEMPESEVADFLEEVGVGTLAFGTEDGGYAIPMSFGYDRYRDRCVFQFAFEEDSQKRSYVDRGNPVSLSIYEWEDVDDWRSVVVRGTLHPVEEEEEVPQSAGVFASFARIASPEVFRHPLEEIDFEWYELRIERKTGRVADGRR